MKEDGESACFGFVGEEMDVLGHEDVGRNPEVLLLTSLFENLLNDVFCCFATEEGLALITTEGDEVELLGVV